MEIIKKGNKEKPKKVYQYKCRCGCIFNATFPDDYRAYGYSETFDGVSCPFCERVFIPNLFARIRYKRYVDKIEREWNGKMIDDIRNRIRDGGCGFLST